MSKLKTYVWSNTQVSYLRRAATICGVAFAVSSINAGAVDTAGSLDFNAQCSGCHTATTTRYPTLAAVKNYVATKTRDVGVAYIRDRMPPGTPTDCGQVCAEGVYDYLKGTTAASSVASAAASSVGNTASTLFSLDFEAVAAGGTPAGFTKEGAGIAVVVGQEAHSGTHSIKFSTSSGYNGSGFFTMNNISGKHWGRLYYKMKTPVPNTGGYLHGTFVKSKDSSGNEFRFVDTVQNPQGAHQYIYNKEPGDVALQGQYAYKFDSTWVCTEWFVDNTTQTYRFFRNDQELSFTNNGAITNKTNLSGFASLPTTLNSLSLGFVAYQTTGTPMEGWIDDVAVGSSRIGCGTAVNNSSSAMPVASSVASSSVPASSVASSVASSIVVPASSVSSVITSVAASSVVSSYAPVSGSWTLSNAESYLNFVSTKNVHTIQANKFKVLSGAVTAAGVATLSIDMNSLDTTNPINDASIKRTILQTVDFPTAEVTVTLDTTLLSSLGVNESRVVDITAQLSLHGGVGAVTTKVRVQRLSSSKIIVQSIAPVIVAGSTTYALKEGIEIWRQTEGLESATGTVPVDFVLVFNAQ